MYGYMGIRWSCGHGWGVVLGPTGVVAVVRCIPQGAQSQRSNRPTFFILRLMGFSGLKPKPTRLKIALKHSKKSKRVWAIIHYVDWTWSKNSIRGPNGSKITHKKLFLKTFRSPCDGSSSVKTMTIPLPLCDLCYGQNKYLKTFFFFFLIGKSL